MIRLRVLTVYLGRLLGDNHRDDEYTTVFYVRCCRVCSNFSLTLCVFRRQANAILVRSKAITRPLRYRIPTFFVLDWRRSVEL